MTEPRFVRMWPKVWQRWLVLDVLGAYSRIDWRGITRFESRLLVGRNGEAHIVWRRGVWPEE